MAGHSKFANIKHRKGAQDKKKSKNITKCIRLITIAAKLGGDPALNPKLKFAIDEARYNFVPKDKIENAIKRVIEGHNDDAHLVSVRYNANYSGIAFIIEALTDNKNRTAGDVRAILTKNGANMVETGSVEFMFDHIGLITYKKNQCAEEKMFEIALEAGAQNIESDDDYYYIETLDTELHKVSVQMLKTLPDQTSCEIIWQAKDNMTVDEEKQKKIEKIVDLLEDHDDIEKVFVNI